MEQSPSQEANYNQTPRPQQHVPNSHAAPSSCVRRCKFDSFSFFSPPTTHQVYCLVNVYYYYDFPPTSGLLPVFMKSGSTCETGHNWTETLAFTARCSRPKQHVAVKKQLFNLHKKLMNRKCNTNCKH